MILKTKYGSAGLRPDGYYVIRSRKEGNRGKLLHRLIFEDFYQCDLNEVFPEGVVIHHVDEDKTNNEIWNLIPLTNAEHTAIHKAGATKYHRVSVINCPTCKNGVSYRYQYFDENRNRKSISNIDINKLESEVKKRGLQWFEIKEDN